MAHLWRVTLASEPVAQGLIEAAWSEGRSGAPPVGPLLAELTDSACCCSVGSGGGYRARFAAGDRCQLDRDFSAIQN